MSRQRISVLKPYDFCGMYNYLPMIFEQVLCKSGNHLTKKLKYHGVLDMSKENASFVLENVKFSCRVVDEVIRRGFDSEKVTIYSDQGSIKAKYEGKFPGGQKELDRIISKCIQKYGPAICFFNFRGISEHIKMEGLESSLKEHNIDILEKDEQGMNMKLKHAGSLQELSDAVMNIVSELFDNTGKL